MPIKATLIGLIALSTLVACGDTTAERAIIGAGAGTATAAVVGGNLAAGAAIGSAANLIYCKEFSNNC